MFRGLPWVTEGRVVDNNQKNWIIYSPLNNPTAAKFFPPFPYRRYYPELPTLTSHRTPCPVPRAPGSHPDNGSVITLPVSPTSSSLCSLCWVYIHAIELAVSQKIKTFVFVYDFFFCEFPFRISRFGQILCQMNTHQTHTSI